MSRTALGAGDAGGLGPRIIGVARRIVPVTRMRAIREIAARRRDTTVYGPEVPFQSGYVPSGSARIFLEESGVGRPVLFAHAGVTDRRMWDAQFEEDHGGHRYIRSDMRGYGNSEWVAEAYSPHTDLLAVIEALELEDLILVGCSMGGKAIMELAVAIPERISGLFIIGAGQPGWSPPNGGYTPPQWEDIPALEKMLEDGEWERLTRIDAEVWLAGFGREIEDVDPGLLARFEEMDNIPIRTELEREDYMTWMEPPISERIHEISIPSLVVVGQHDLPDIVESTARLAGLISDRPRIVIPGSAHLPSFERPDLVNPILGEFISRV